MMMCGASPDHRHRVLRPEPQRDVDHDEDERDDDPPDRIECDLVPEVDETFLTPDA